MDRRFFVKAGLGIVAGGLVFSDARTWASMDEKALAFHVERKLVETRFGNISCWDRGAGPSTALFLHGWPLNGFHWRDVMAGLTDVRRCLAPDFMGLGYSEVPQGADLSPQGQCQMLIALLDALSIERVDVVANDSGTAVAQLLAVSIPDRVESLLLTNGDVHTNSPPEGLQPAIEAARAGRLIEFFERHTIDLEFARGPEGLGGLTYTFPESLTPESIRLYFEPLLSSPLRRKQCQEYGVAFEPNPLPAIEQLLRQLSKPVRVVWGTGDALFPECWAQWLDETLPLSRGVRYIDGANLFFPEEFPDVLVDEARRLWG